MLPNAPYLRRLAPAALAHASAGVSLGLLVLLPVHFRSIGASHALAGFANGIAFGVGLTVRPLAGWALDRLGRRPVILAGSLLALGGGLMYLATDRIDSILYLGRVLTGAGEGLIFSGFFTYAADVVPAERRAQGIALFGISGLLPMAVAPAFGERVVAAGGFPALFVVSLAFGALSTLTSLTLPETRPAGPPGGPVLVEMLRVVGAPRLRGVWILIGTFGVGLAATQTFVAPMAVESGVGQAGLFFACYGLSAILLRVFAGSVPDRVGHARVAGPSVAVYAVGAAVLALPPSRATLIAGGILGGVGHGFIFPSASAMAVDRAPAHQRGVVLAALTGILDLCFLVASPTLGWVGDQRGHAALFTVAALGVLLGLALWRWQEGYGRTISSS